MVKNVYEVSIEDNNIDVSPSIVEVLERYLTNQQSKVSVELMRTEDEVAENE